MCCEGFGLMQLYVDPHGGKEPPVVPMATHPAPFQCEAVLDDAWHGLYGLAALLAQSTIDRPIQHGDPRE
jgi:hypothetical protein